MNDDDLGLLARYTRERDEDAFSQIVRRHLNLVYSVARRQVRSPELAEEVAQSVFTQLAREAQSLAPDTVLAAWLYTVAHRTALNGLRREVRRKRREQVASEMNASDGVTAGDWAQVSPCLDAAMHALNQTERTAILLRYFENKSLREVGQILGTTDDAAQKRVSRALEHLRKRLARQGVTVSVGGLVALVAGNAVQAAPTGLAALISSGSLLAATATTSLPATATTILAMTTLQKSSVAAFMVAALALPSLIQHHSASQLREENRSLRRQVARLTESAGLQRGVASGLPNGSVLPPPRMPVAPVAAEPAAELQRTNLIGRLLRLQAQDRQPKLTPQQIDSYLQKSGRTAATLLAAFRTTGDYKLLEEAMGNYPRDAEVSFTALFQGWFGSNQAGVGPVPGQEPSPLERRQWLEAFKQSAPDNSLANYLSALGYFKVGQADQAVEELNAASAKPRFQDYSADFTQNDEEAWLAAGYSTAEAKTAASMLLVLPHLGAMKELSQDIVSLANSYRQAGDPASAEVAWQAGLDLGQKLNGSPDQSLVNQLVGDAIQSIFLRQMDPASAFGQTGQTVQDRLDQLAAERAAITALTKQFDAVQPQVSEQDWISYKDRWRSFGEEAALKWIVAKYSPH